MLSSRSYYNSDLPEFYRRSENGLRMSLGQNSPIVDQYDTASQLSRRTTPSSEADKSGVAPRKRVPVACDRCRKRKIKCSGDQGGGCTNCHQAGVSSCQFLRVQSIGPSEIMQRAMYGRPVRYSPYSYTSPNRYYNPSPSSYSPPSHSTYNGMQTGIDYSSYNTPSQNLSWPRSNSYSNAFSPYDAEPTSPYTSQPPNFILPNTDPMGSGNPYLVNPYSTKSQTSQAWPEQASSVPNSQPSSQLMTVGYALPSSEALMTYESIQDPASSSLKPDHALAYLSSQQPPTLSSDRTLPNPSARNYPSSAMSALDRQNVDSIPLSATSHRSSLGSLGWQTDTASSSSHISSQTSVSSVGGSHDFSNSDRPAIHRDSEDLTYNYLGYSNCPQSIIPSNALATITNDQSSQSTLHAAAELGSQRCRTVSHEGSVQESPSTASSSYGYTGATQSVAPGSQSRNASGQLSNGATYARAQAGTGGLAGAQGIVSMRRESEGVDPSEECGADCSACQPQSGLAGSSRASIASINNLASY